VHISRIEEQRSRPGSGASLVSNSAASRSSTPYLSDRRCTSGPGESLKRGVRLRPEQQGCKDHGHGEEGKSYDQNCHCSDPLQPPLPSGDPPGTAVIRTLLLESPLELLSGVHVIPPTGHRALLCL
jgi:hypothetical protein